MSDNFKRGFAIAAGVLVAVFVISMVTKLLK